MAKYLFFTTKEEGELSILFEDVIGHDEMLAMVSKKYTDVKAISAGFWFVDLKGNIKAQGRSVSLNIDSRDDDSWLLNLRYLGKLK